MNRLRRLILPAIVLAAATILSQAGAATAQSSTPSTWTGAVFLVQPQDGDTTTLDLSLDIVDPALTPARISLEVPNGFSIYPQRPIGSTVGTVELYAADYAAGAAGTTLLDGQIVAQQPDASTEAALQPCSPGSHLAVWDIAFTLLGQPLQIPIGISATPTASTSDSLTLDICPPPLLPTGTLLPIRSLHLSLWDLSPPRAKGTYTWKAAIVPLAPDLKTPLPDSTLELRSILPVPHTLTLHGNYQTPTHRVALHGTLREAGKPVPGARIEITKLSRKITPNGVIFNDTPIGTPRTNHAGNYTLTTRLTTTAGFIATTQPRLTPCPDKGPTPRGCQNETITGTTSEPITISIPTKHT
jgi:hypothetical protein